MKALGESFKISRYLFFFWFFLFLLLFFFAFLLKIMCVYFLLFKNIFKDSRKKKYLKKKNVSRQFSIRVIGNVGCGIAERHGQNTVASFMRVNSIGV